MDLVDAEREAIRIDIHWVQEIMLMQQLISRTNSLLTSWRNRRHTSEAVVFVPWCLFKKKNKKKTHCFKHTAPGLLNIEVEL